jgi:hypothetical protein
MTTDDLSAWALEEACNMALYWNPRATSDDVDVERIAEALVAAYRRGVRRGDELRGSVERAERVAAATRAERDEQWLDQAKKQLKRERGC